MSASRGDPDGRLGCGNRGPEGTWRRSGWLDDEALLHGRGLATHPPDWQRSGCLESWPPPSDGDRRLSSYGICAPGLAESEGVAEMEDEQAKGSRQH